ncbi:MAG: hypothetical protein QNI98_08975 [Woeseiaceae bacterium]|nr:hypothetical protein [Woeseiaceae bacterium]
MARKTDGNPEGKGSNGFLLDWERTEPRGVVVKPRRQLLAEFFTSMLILSAKFKFRPAIGAATYLYWIDHEWSLSLIAPEQWSDERRAGFAGTCMLQADMTWTLNPSASLKDKGPVADAMARFYEAFAEKLDTDLTLEEILPFYVGTMPYYQRLFASAMSRSFRAAVILGDQTGTSCRDWQALLPRRGNSLLEYAR